MVNVLLNNAMQYGQLIMRKCKTCEYYKVFTGVSGNYPNGECYFNPPTVAGGSTSGLKTAYPKVKEDARCSKWEPKWEQNPIIDKAWKEFLLVQKMARDNK